MRFGGRPRGRVLFVAVTPLIAASSSFAAAPSFTGITTGTIQNSAINEASGIAASRINPNVLWTHNDSGGSAQVFALTPAGANLGTYNITGAGATDWEDIAVGPGPGAGVQYLYAGDIGDNNAVRANISVYRVPEPTVSDTQSPVTLALGGMAKLTFSYPDGARDAESLFVDPLTRDIYIITKREATAKRVYRAAYPQATSGTTSLELVTTLANANWITAADISPDGDEIIMRAGATNTGLMYTRPAGGTIADAFATTPISIPLLSETQGEAIGFDPSGWGYFTTSEGSGAPIHYYNRLAPPAAPMYWDNDAVVAGTYVSSGAGMGGTGAWNTSALKWYNGSADVAWTNGNNAVFWGSAGTVTLASAMSANSLSFKTGGYVITGSTLTLGGSSITVDAGVSATISSIVAGSAGLAKSGTGTLTLTGVNTYSGPTSVSAGTLVLTGNHTTGASISVASAAAFSITSGSAAVIKTGSVAVAESGKLDLADNKLIVTGQSRAAIEPLVIAGRNGGAWNGAGIVTSMPLAVSQLTTLAVASAGDVGKSTFGGMSVGGSDVLVMYTYAGDANLSGKIDGDDFFRIDAGFSAQLSGYASGDFDYSGSIDADDYFLIDRNYARQGAGFGSAAAAVPEPGVAAVLLAFFGLFSRRRRRAVA